MRCSNHFSAQYIPRIFFAFSFVLLALCFFRVADAQAWFQDTTYIFSQNIGTGALTALSAQNVTQTKATITGKVDHNTPGFAIYLDLHQAGDFTDHFVPQVKNDGTFSYQLTGLTPAYTYHFIAVDAFDGRTALSAMNSFVTPPVSANIYVSKIEDKNATIQATITEGAKNPKIIYGTKFGSLGNPTAMTSSNGVYTAQIGGLTADTNYYYQLEGDSYTSSGVQVYYSGVLSFMTLPTPSGPAPAVPTVPDSNSSSTSLTSSSYNGGALVHCGLGGPLNDNGTQACGFKDLMELANRIIDFLIFVVAPIIAVVIILYGGFLILTAAGSTENIGKAKSMMTKAVIGLVIAMAAWLLVKSILVSMGVDTSVFPVFY